MICSKCGKFTKRSYSGMCQGCYNYFRKGGVIHSLPACGTIEHDKDGKIICHICGKSFSRLGSHVKESHAMTIAEYKAEFGLCNCSKTTEQNYSNTMKTYAYKNEMDKRLLEAGKSTRIKSGETDKRKNKKTRLQESIEKRNRKYKGDWKND